MKSSCSLSERRRAICSSVRSSGCFNHISSKKWKEKMVFWETPSLVFMGNSVAAFPFSYLSLSRFLWSVDHFSCFFPCEFVIFLLVRRWRVPSGTRARTFLGKCWCPVRSTQWALCSPTVRRTENSLMAGIWRSGEERSCFVCLRWSVCICLCFAVFSDLWFLIIKLIYNPKSEKVGTVWKTQIKKESSDF